MGQQYLIEIYAYFIEGTKGVLVLFGADTATFEGFIGEINGSSPTELVTPKGVEGDR